MKKHIRLFIIVLVIVFVCSGCVVSGKKKETRWRPVKQKKHLFIHQVRWKSETYEVVSKWYTGNVKNAEKVISSNPALNPEKLHVGDNVYIPKNILRTREKLPRGFVEKFFKKSTRKRVKKSVKRKKKPVQKSEQVQDDFQLFGPR